MRLSVCALAAAAAVLAASPALACKGKTVLFEDNFASGGDSGWELWEQIKIEGGAMKITATPGHIAPVFYKGDTYDKADICADAVTPSGNDPKNEGIASLLFEGQAYDDFYAFYVSPRFGKAGIARLFKTKWLYPMPFRSVEGINAQPGGINTLRVTLDGAHATAYVNDHKIVEVKINAAEGGGFVGLNVDGGESMPVTLLFKSFKVTDLP